MKKRSIVIETGIGKRIKLLRTTAGHTQAEVAAHIGIETRQVSRKEKNSNAWAVWELIKVADLYDTTVSYLATGVEGPAHETSPTLSPVEHRLLLCYRTCSEEDQRVMLLNAIDLALKSK